MSDYVYLLSLLVLVVVVWFAGRHSGKNYFRQFGGVEKPPPHYLKGINFLLSAEPDQAIEHFIQAVEVTSETLETHLAFGNLMRQRGELEEAIRVHQNLLSRPNLNAQEIRSVQVELAKDFQKAGVYDRAERILLDLVEDEAHECWAEATELLVQIYRNEQAWEKAIRAADRVHKKRRLSKKGSPFNIQQAQFCCELACEQMAGNDYMQARRYLKRALKYNRQCARATLLWGQLEMQQRNFAMALKLFKKVPVQQPHVLPEALPFVSECYHQLNDTQGMLIQLQAWFERYPSASLLGYVVEALTKAEGITAGKKFLVETLQRYPSVAGMLALLDMESATPQPSDGQEHLVILRKVLEKIGLSSTKYRCTHCGFQGTSLHWLCPQCERWETVRLTAEATVG